MSGRHCIRHLRSRRRFVATTPILPFALAALAAHLTAAGSRGSDTVVTINEIHYHPADDSGDPEWIEIVNQMSIRIDLSGWRFDDGVSYAFPEGTVIEPGQHLVVSGAQGSPPGALGPFLGRLDNAGERIRLTNRHGRVMDEVVYGDEDDWPTEPDGGGPSLAKRLSSLGTADPLSWIPSAEAGGTPGALNFPAAGAPGQRAVFPTGGSWRYEASGAAPPPDWTTLAFRDTAWSAGTAPLGWTAIVNGGFEADRFTVEPGLVSENGPITGWSIEPAADDDHVGLARPPGEAEFADNGSTPGGATVAFIRGGASRELTQDASGLTPGTGYLLHFRINAQAGSAILTSAQADGRQVLPPFPATSVEPAGSHREPYHHAVGAPFAASAEVAGIAIEAHATDPAALLIDELRIVPAVLDDAFGGELSGSAAAAVPYSPGNPSAEILIHARFRGEIEIGFCRSGEPNAIPSRDGALWVRVAANGAVSVHEAGGGGDGSGPLVQASAPEGFDPSAGHDLALVWEPARSVCSVLLDGASVVRETALTRFPDVRGLAARTIFAGSVVERVAVAESLPAPATPIPGDRPINLRRSFAYIGGLDAPDLRLEGTLRGAAEIHLNGVAVGRIERHDGAFGMVLPGDALAFGANVLAVRLSPVEGLAGIHFDTSLTLIEPDASRAPGAPHSAGAIVINEIHYHDRPRYADPAAGIDFAESPDEWIELHNRTDTAVDLEGWRLSGAVDHAFPPGTSLAARGFLVVDQDAFSGSLGNRSERIRLRDASGAVIDEVRYFDGGRWPAEADGGGSSLELLDPDADNQSPEAWAASDESGRSEWRTYRYRALGAEPPNSDNPDNWREFLVGFLDAGEALIDDVSVVEDPDGANRQLIRNGGFEDDVPGLPPATWRILGTHQLSRVIRDPDGPSGQVLHLVATGEADHTFNVASTTLAGNRIIFPGREYEIAFRAKWLRGSPQLNTRLYLNRAARTTILAQPEGAGTPGTPNRAAVANLGPTFDHLRHDPPVPDPNQPVRVTVDADDPDGVRILTLHYSIDGGSWDATVMAGDPAGRHVGTIPGLPDRSLVQFFVSGADREGAVSVFPPGGPDSRALYRVGDGGVSAHPVPNRLRLLMLPEEVAALHDRLHSVSNFRWGGTLIDNDREIYYDVGVRLRAAPYGRQGSRAGWNIRVGEERPFRGVHSSIVIDGALNMPRGDGTGWIETTIGASLNEMIYNLIANRAGNIDANYDDIAFFAAPRPQDNRVAQLKLARFNDAYLDSVRPEGSEGTVFKQELIYYPTTTVDGNPESLKNPYNMVRQVDIRNMGPDRESYRYNYLIRGNRRRDDYSRIIAMGQAFSASNIELGARTDAVLDIESWMRVLALNALTGLADTYNNGLAHNIVFYDRPEDRRIVLMPWDQDHAFYYSTSASIYGQGSHRVRDVIALPRNRRLYCGHLLDLCRTGFDPAYLTPWVQHLNAVAGQFYSTNFLGWIDRRRNFVLAQLESEHPPREFTVTTNDGGDLTTADPTVTLRGEGWIDVHRIRVLRADTVLVLTPTWLDDRRWELTLPLVVGANGFSLEALDRQGTLVGSDAITITNTGATEPASAANLVVSEIHYHPLAPDAQETAAGFASAEDFEFLELLNIGQRTIDLEGVAFTEGIDFAFDAAAPVRQLAPGARAVLVSRFAAFVRRHGAGIPIAGQFVRNLGNSGERITLIDRTGTVIQSIEWEDSLPWPPEADGDGRSLTRILPDSQPDGSSAEAWRPSVALHGSPGTDDALPETAFPDPITYALTGPASALASAGSASSALFTWPERLGADDVRVVPEISLDGARTWIRDPGDESILEIIDARIEEPGTRRITAEVADTTPDATPPRNLFLRLAIEERPTAHDP